MLTSLSPAKLNLYLHLTGKRPDGYHLLDSLMVFLDIGDRLYFTHAEEISLDCTGPINIAADEDNLVLKAARLLANHSGYRKGAAITLEKHLPLGGGLGGGSANAAATLKSLNTLWELGLSETKLLELALQLGADVPVCVYGKPAYIGGIGEVIEPARGVPPFHGVLIHPGVVLSTPAVFKHEGHVFHTEPVRAEGSWLEFLRKQTNALQPAATALLPVIPTMLNVLEAEPQCLLARMSGSGATCFGLFVNEANARQAVVAIKSKHPQWWVQSATMLSAS